MGGLSLHALVVLAIVWASALIYYDLRYHRLPNLLTVPAALVSVVWALFMQNTGQILWSAVTWPALYIAQLVVSFSTMGGTDVIAELVAVTSNSPFPWGLPQPLSAMFLLFYLHR